MYLGTMSTTMEKTDSKRPEDGLRSYYSRIKNISLLTAEEEKELARRIRRGDEEARKRLIEANLRLVVKIARTFSAYDVPLIDLIQEGNMGLIKAAEKFDDRKNARFSTYASWWIKQAITRSLVNSRRAIRLPHRKEELLKRIQRTYNVLMQTLQTEPTPADIARDLRVPEESVVSVLEMSGNLVSLDAEDSEDSGAVIDIVEDLTYEPSRQFDEVCAREKVMEMLELLMEKERRILLYRFEFFGGERYTLKRIGAELGISPETVRQIEKRALNKLRDQTSQVEYMTT